MRKSIVDAAYEKFKAKVLDKDPVVKTLDFEAEYGRISVYMKTPLTYEVRVYSWPTSLIFLFGGYDSASSEVIMSVFEFAWTLNQNSISSCERDAVNEILKYSSSSAEELMLKLEIKS